MSQPLRVIPRLADSVRSAARSGPARLRCRPRPLRGHRCVALCPPAPVPIGSSAARSCRPDLTRLAECQAARCSAGAGGGCARLRLRVCGLSLGRLSGAPAGTGTFVKVRRGLLSRLPVPTLALLIVAARRRSRSAAVTRACSTPRARSCAGATTGKSASSTESGGDAGAGSDGQVSQAPVEVGAFVSVSVGGRHACAVTQDGVALCWGANE